MLGIFTDLFLAESDFFLRPPPGSCLGYSQWALCPLELYRSGNMVRLGWFSLSIPPSIFLTSPLFALPSWALQEVHMSLRLLSPNGTTVSSGVFTPAVDRSVTMHNPRYKFLSQLCCGSGIQIRVSGWPLFGRKIGRSLFTC